MRAPPAGRTVAPMHASSMSEAGALRIVLAVVLAAVVSLAVGTAFSVTAGIAIAALAVIAGVAFEIRHMQF